MSVDMHTLANRANSVITDTGFLQCTVHSEENRELAFEFESAVDAEAFCAGRALLKMQVRIENDAPTVVIVRQE